MRKVWVAALCALLVATIVALPSAASAARGRTTNLWVVDDITLTTYQITEDGVLLTSFPTPNTAKSSIAVDPKDGTLWGANEGTAAGSPGKLVNYDRSGNVIREISAADFGAVRTEGMALTFDRRNPTLWIVDDPPSDTGAVPTVYNITRNGDLISSFPTSDFDVAATSPQAIAFDRYSASLWITDNAADRVYNVSLTGGLIASFATDEGPFVTVTAPNGVKNVQGVSVESSEYLWITARDTSTVYRVTRAGDAVVQSFTLTSVDPAAFDPTGVAVDIPRRVRG